MQQEFSREPIGGRVGTEAIESAEERANQYCQQEHERIALANEHKVLASRAKSQILTMKANKLTERIRNAPPRDGDARSRRRKAVRLKGNGTPIYSIQDVNGDGLLDLVVQVQTSALDLRSADSQATLKGKTFGGTRIQGTAVSAL
jgi:hypothetical protein